MNWQDKYHEHFGEAERLGAEAVRVSPAMNPQSPFDEQITGNEHARQLIGLAQMHATLALAAVPPDAGQPV